MPSAQAAKVWHLQTVVLFFLTGKPPKDAGKLDYMCMYIYIHLHWDIYIECTCDNVSTCINIYTIGI